MISNTAVGFILLVYCIVLSHAVDSNADKAVLVDLFTSTGGNATWNVSWPIQSSAVSYCSYGGVTCLTDSGGISRVAAISLEKLNLVGTLPASLGNLTYLSTLSITYNPQLTGTIPPSIALLPLTTLKLSFNDLIGSIPAALSQCLSLRSLDLSANVLNGTLPSSFSLLTNLQSLIISGNRIEDALMLSKLSHMSALRNVSLTGNTINAALNAFDLSPLSNLTVLDLSFTKLTGSIPRWISNLTQLRTLSLSANQLSGSLPDVSQLTSLNYLFLNGNQLSSEIPISINRLSSLQILDLGSNQFSGSLPNMTSLRSLNTLNIDSTSLAVELPGWISSMRSLAYFNASFNSNVTGSITDLLGNITAIQQLRLDSTQVRGTLPEASLNLSSLTVLSLNNLQLYGTLPSNFSKFVRLRQLRLNNCGLSGTIPPSWSQLSALTHVSLAQNSLTGDLMQSISKLWNAPLLFLDFSSNQFTGSLSVVDGKFLFPTFINISYNSLSSRLPESNVIVSSAFAPPILIDARGIDFICPVPTFDPSRVLVLHHHCKVIWNPQWEFTIVNVVATLGALWLVYLVYKVYLAWRPFIKQAWNSFRAAYSRKYSAHLLLTALIWSCATGLWLVDVYSYQVMFVEYFHDASLDLCSPLSSFSVFEGLMPDQRASIAGSTSTFVDVWSQYGTSPFFSATAGTGPTFAQVANALSSSADRLSVPYLSAGAERTFSEICETVSAGCTYLPSPVFACQRSAALAVTQNALKLPTVRGVSSSFGGMTGHIFFDQFLWFLYAAAAGRLIVELCCLLAILVSMFRQDARWLACVPDLVKRSPFIPILIWYSDPKFVLEQVFRHRISRADIWRRFIYQCVLSDALSLLVSVIYLYYITESAFANLWVQASIIYHFLFLIPVSILAYRACNQAQKANRAASEAESRRLLQMIQEIEKDAERKRRFRVMMLEFAGREQYRVMAQKFGNLTIRATLNQTEEQWQEAEDIGWEKAAAEMGLDLSKIDPRVIAAQRRCLRAGLHPIPLEEDLPLIDGVPNPETSPLFHLLQEERARAERELQELVSKLREPKPRPETPGVLFRFKDDQLQARQYVLGKFQARPARKASVVSSSRSLETEHTECCSLFTCLTSCCKRLRQDNSASKSTSDKVRSPQTSPKASPTSRRSVAFDVGPQQVQIDIPQAPVESNPDESGAAFTEHQYRNEPLDADLPLHSIIAERDRQQDVDDEPPAPPLSSDDSDSSTSDSEDESSANTDEPQSLEKKVVTFRKVYARQWLNEHREEIKMLDDDDATKRRKALKLIKSSKTALLALAADSAAQYSAKSEPIASSRAEQSKIFDCNSTLSHRFVPANLLKSSAESSVLTSRFLAHSKPQVENVAVVVEPADLADDDETDVVSSTRHSRIETSLIDSTRRVKKPRGTALFEQIELDTTVASRVSMDQSYVHNDWVARRANAVQRLIDGTSNIPPHLTTPFECEQPL